MYADITATQLLERLDRGGEPFILDVREPEEFAEWAIPGALNVPLGQLAARGRELPRDREIVVVCASGNRSSQAAMALARAGLPVANLKGGMLAWGTVYDTASATVGDATIVQVRRRGKGCLSYIVGSGTQAFVIDPAIDIDHYIRLAGEHGWRITRVFDTHLHADHLSGARDLAEATHAELHLNPADTFSFAYTPLTDRQRFELPGGTQLSVATLHTPGHTMGSTVYGLDDGVLFTGDTVFVDGVGRPDLAERAAEFAHNLYRSLHDRILTQAGDTLVLPGHYGAATVVRPDTLVATTLAALRSTLDPLGYDEDAFVAWATDRSTERPPNYEQIIRANMGTPETSLLLLKRMEIGPNRCSA